MSSCRVQGRGLGIPGTHKDLLNKYYLIDISLQKKSSMYLKSVNSNSKNPLNN